MGKRRIHYVSKLFIPTSRTIPVEAAHSTPAHQLMLRAGMLRQSLAGVYTMLPLGLRAMEKVESIVDDELRSLGAHKLSMPSLLSSTSWKATGRWHAMGHEVFRFRDRKGSELLLAPTHEEEVTHLVSKWIDSPKQLPFLVYQVGRKYRDEARPRAGLLRGREFVMKDLYSFDGDVDGATQTYDKVVEAYRRIFDRIGVPYLQAEADTGSIGGTLSHEFHFVSPIGEDHVLTCGDCGYTTNAECASKRVHVSSEIPSMRIHYWKKADATLNSELIASVIPSNRTVNAIVYHRRGFVEADPVDPGATCDVSTVEIDSTLGLVSKDDILSTLTSASRVSRWTYDLDLSRAIDGDGCPRCYPSHDAFVSRKTPHHGILKAHRAIEVGHTFLLGDRYSAPLNATIPCTHEDGTVKHVPMQMGCFGIGISRIIAGALESLLEAGDGTRKVKGLRWPIAIAPYQCAVLYFNPRHQRAAHVFATAVERVLGKDTIVVDDRDDASPGWKMGDAELIGYPWVVVFGRGYEESGGEQVELWHNSTGERYTFPIDRAWRYILEHPSQKR